MVRRREASNWMALSLKRCKKKGLGTSRPNAGNDIDPSQSNFLTPATGRNYYCGTSSIALICGFSTLLVNVMVNFPLVTSTGTVSMYALLEPPALT